MCVCLSPSGRTDGKVGQTDRQIKYTYMSCSSFRDGEIDTITCTLRSERLLHTLSCHNEKEWFPVAGSAAILDTWWNEIFSFPSSLQ